MAQCTVTVISKSYIAQEHVSAEAKVYLVLMYVLDIHDFIPTWKFSCTEKSFNETGDEAKPKALLIMSVLCMSRQ